jgi:hypothetical protein
MNWKFFCGKINEDYSWELELFRRWRNSKNDGKTFFELKANLDVYPSDHNPRFEFYLIIFNFLIFDFEIYNIWHIEHERSPYYELPL